MEFRVENQGIVTRTDHPVVDNGDINECILITAVKFSKLLEFGQVAVPLRKGMRPVG
jgi:hypothetical protein